MSIVEFVDWCLKHNISYEYGRNWCDCVDYSVFINFWIDCKVHTLYALDNGSFKLDSVIVTSIKDIEEALKI